MLKEAAERWKPGDPMPKGIPRPVMPYPSEADKEKDLPVPWSQSDKWGVGDTPGRYDEAKQEGLCLLCGEPVKEGQVIVYKVPQRLLLPSSYTFKDLHRHEVIDNAPLHDRCAKLTIAHCPHINEGIGDNTMFTRHYKSKDDQEVFGKVAHTLGWEPGNYGKGLVFDNNDGTFDVHTWNTQSLDPGNIEEDSDGAPWHFQYLKDNFGSPNVAYVDSFWINPDGLVSGNHSAIEEADSRLKLEGSWIFGKVANEDYRWTGDIDPQFHKTLPEPEQFREGTVGIQTKDGFYVDETLDEHVDLMRSVGVTDTDVSSYFWVQGGQWRGVEENVNADRWKFTGQNSRDKIDHNRDEWARGFYFIDKDEIHTWNKENIHHWSYLEELVGGENAKMDNALPFFISPKNEISFPTYYSNNRSSDTELQEIVADRLGAKNKGGTPHNLQNLQWNFSKVAVTLNVIDPESSDFHNKTYDSPERTRWPLVYDPNTETVHVGQPGWHHAVITNILYGRVILPEDDDYYAYGTIERQKRDNKLESFWFDIGNHVPDESLQSEIDRQLEQHFDEPIRSYERGSWRFGQVNPDELHVALEIPKEVRNQIKEWVDEQEWPEGTELEDPEDYHITLLYSEEGHEDHADADWIDHSNGYNVEVTGIDEFGEEDDKAIVLRINSPAVEDHAKELQDKAEDQDVEINRFPGGYKPHITVAYGPEKPTNQHLELQFKTGPSDVSEPRTSANKIEFTPGRWHKGFVHIPTNEIEVWPTDATDSAQDGRPWHIEKIIHEVRHYRFFEVTPDGEVTANEFIPEANFIQDQIGASGSGQDKWNFSKVGASKSEWESGTHGKGIYDKRDGSLYTWSTVEEGGDPHHGDYLTDHNLFPENVPENWNYDEFVLVSINPDGTLETDLNIGDLDWSEYVQNIQSIDPRFKVVRFDHWNFAKVASDEYFYHAAPTIERQRIIQHGLQPSRPHLNRRWWSGPDKAKWLENQPEGIYAVGDLSNIGIWAYSGDMPNKTDWDVWRIPTEQIKDMTPDPIVQGAYVITHPVHAELYKKAEDEWEDEDWDKEEDEDLAWHEIRDYEDNPEEYATGYPKRPVRLPLGPQKFTSFTPQQATAIFLGLRGRSLDFTQWSNDELQAVYNSGRVIAQRDPLYRGISAQIAEDLEDRGIDPDQLVQMSYRVYTNGELDWHGALTPELNQKLEELDRLEEEAWHALEESEVRGYSDEEIERLVDEGWKPGNYGKAIVTDSGRYDWVVDGHGSPHHQEVESSLGIEGTSIMIDRDGTESAARMDFDTWDLT